MKELHAILETWRADRQAPGVLATVVHVERSAYRRPGARMWISTDGCRRIGTISGGCLEGDVTRKAAWWTAGGDPVVRVYDTGSEDAVLEFGLGCDGVVHVLLERMESAGTQALLRYLDDAQRERRPCVVGTVVRTSRTGGRGRYHVGDHLMDFAGDLESAARDVLFAKRSRLLHAAEADVFLEYIAPRQRVVIFGAGHDVVPVVALGSSLGWDITVADVRSGYLKPERFPGANEVLRLPQDGDISSVSIDSGTVVVLMTHNLRLDAKLLPQLCVLEPSYVGCLGPHSRMRKVALEAGGANLAGLNLHSPAGLDLGGDSPEAVALSIIAEMQAHLHRRSASSLRNISGSIHAPVDERGRVAADLDVSQTVTALCEVA